MSDSTHVWVWAALFFAALGYWVFVEFFIRLGGNPLRPSAVRVWLRVTAPLVAIVLLIVALFVLINT
jgi:hypothetical protein